ncbi:MAG: hypothetical protein HY694_07690 [Deltaproteobacteria bacterium]|nr:hypothetical protein [Deltaproteobacteria bacterium]
MENKSALKVYCDTGALREELKTLQDERKLILVMFPYENKNRKIGDVGLPSEVTWDDLKNLTWDTLPGVWDDYKGSEKYNLIAAVVGKDNREDAMHLDSAYKSGCQCFFTRDKADIYSKRKTLEGLLGMKVYHSDEDWEEFLNSIKDLP